MMYSLRFTFSLLILTSAALLAQKAGTGGNSGGNTGGNTGGSTGGSTTRPPASVPQPTFPGDASSQMPIFISGKVMAADGSPLPSGIPIQRVCGIEQRTVAYTDSKGRFSFEWGNPAGVLPDASEVGNLDPRTAAGMPPSSGRSNNGFGAMNGGTGLGSLAGCELRVNANGFRADNINLNSHRAMDNPEVGTFILHRLAAVEGTSISATALAAPKDARREYEKGLESMRRSKPDDALKQFQKAVDLYPKYATAWLDLGRVYILRKEAEPARAALTKAIEADAKLVEPYVQLGQMAGANMDWAEAAKYLDRALSLDPVDYPQLWFLDAVANYNVGQMAVAETSARQALKVDARHLNPRADQLLGLILLKKKDFPGATEEFRTYLRLAPEAKDIDQVKATLAELETNPTAQ